MSRSHPQSVFRIALLALALVSSTAYGDTTFTNGAGGNTWETPGNWSAGLPDSADNTSFSADATLQSTQTVRRLLLENGSLTIENTGGLTGAASIGLVATGRSLTVNSGGTYSRTGTFDLRTGSASITVNDGGAFTLGHLRSSAQGSLIVNGSTANVIIENITTVNGNSSTFVANDSTITLSGATLNVTGLMQWDGLVALPIGAGSTLNLAGAGTHVFSDGVVVSAGGLLKTSGSGTQTLGDAISGDGSLEQNGTGTTTLNVANTYTGGTTLNAGTLVVGDAAAAGTGTITLSGGTLEIAASIGNDISATGSTAIVNNTGTLSLSGGAVTGAGTLAFSVAQQTRFFSDLSGFSGTISHNNDAGGQLRLWNQVEDLSATRIVTSGGTSGSGLLFINSGNDHTIGELSGTGGKILMRGGSGLTLTIDQSTDTTYSGLLQDGDASRKGTLVKDGVGTLTLDGANTYTGGTTLNAGTLVLGNAAAAGTGTIALSGGILQSSGFTHTNAISATGNAEIAVNGSQFNGVFTGTGTLNFVSSGSQSSTFGDWSGFSGTLAHDNTDPTRFNIWNVADTSSVKISTSGDTDTANTGIRFIGGNYTIAELSGTAGRIGGWSNTLTVNQSSDTTYSGHLTDSSGTRKLALTKAGAGTLTLDSDNTYTNSTTINGGTLQLGDGGTTGTLSPDSTISVASGAVFAVDRTNDVSQGTDFSSSAISGDGSFEQNGTGTTTLDVANTYTGGTTINDGTLLVNNTSGSATGTGAVAVNDGATLGGTGSISGTVTIASGATLSPGTP